MTSIRGPPTQQTAFMALLATVFAARRHAAPVEEVAAKTALVAEPAAARAQCATNPRHAVIMASKVPA